MKRKTPRNRLDAMPSGMELERIARRILTELGNNVAKPWLAIYDRKKEADPFTAPLDMAGKFIPVIEAWIDQSGRSLLVSLDQQDADQWLVRAPEVLQAAREAVLDLCNETIEQFTSDTLKTLEGMRLDIAASIESGETAGELTDRISTWIKDNARWRARRIAITESARAYNTGLVKAAESLDFIAGWELLVSGDACPMCHMIYRLCPIIPKGGTFGTNGNNKTYKDLKFPPFHPGCVLGETPVITSGLISAMSAKYQGSLVRVCTADGSEFTVTPNHMILTSSGWASAQDLREGDDIIRSTAIQMDPLTPLGSYPNDNNCPANAEQVFDAIRMASAVPPRSVPASPVDLHGDGRGCHGNIDIVDAERLLSSERDASFGQQPSELPLVVAGRYSADTLNSLGSLDTFLDACLSATGGLVGRSREDAAALWGQSRHPDNISLGAGADGEAHPFKSECDSRPRQSEILRHLQDAVPGLVSCTKIVKIDISISQGVIPVYDFETSQSTYIIANGIVSSNCRCSLLEVFDDEMPKNLKPPVKPGENGYLRPSEADYETADQGGYLSVAIGNAKSFTKTGRILES
jgi:hypothetical protein